MDASEPHSNAIAAIFKARRYALGISYSELSTNTGISERSLLRYLMAQREMQVGHFMIIARALGLEPASVLREITPA
ncbi:MAG: hypothetical protein JWQ68_1860 [Cryobacterium sp.]|jgi:transcriptional regulator with XRE-family HTH domain|nr:hypothetical protein [Cryobacterium sp.]HEV7950269.1 helix-turn-helix transcriptional regulator [Glaciihabitans sp.]